MSSSVIPIDAIRQPALLYGADGRVIAANDLADALAGEPLTGLAIANVLAIFRDARPDGTPLASADLPSARALSGDEVVAEPLVVTLPDGRTLDVLVTASPIRDGGGAVAGAFVTYVDATDRVRLEEGEARMRGLLNRNPCLIFLKDEQGRYVYLNETYEKQFVHRKDWYGKTDFDFWSRESAELFRANDREILGSGETQQFLEDSTDRAGVRYVWLNYKFPFTDARGERYVGGIGIDATARVRAEEALQRSQATLSAALASMTDAVAISDAGGKLVEFNDAFATFHRFGSRDECLRTLPEYPGLLDVSLPDGTWVPPEMWVMPRALRGEAAINAEYTLRRKDTGEEWVGSYSYGPIRDGDGAITGSVMVARDVTDRRRAEEALRASEAGFRAFFETPAIGMVEIGLDRRFTRVNDRFCRITGYNREELLAMTTDDLLPEENRELDRRRLDDYFAGRNPYDVEKRYVRKDGEIIWVQVTAGLIRDTDGVPVRSTATVQEITGRKRAEEALRESEERLVLAQAAGGVGVYDWDLATGEIVWTPQLETVFGMPTPADPQERYDAWFRRVHPDDRGRLLEEMRQWLGSGLDRAAWVYRFRRPDGEERWIEGLSLLVCDRDGQPARVIGTNTDITERKRAEEAMSTSLATLKKSQEIGHLGSWTLNFETGLFEASDEDYRIYGLVPGTPTILDAIWGMIHPDDRDRYREYVESVRLEGRLGGIDYRISWPDGSLRYLHALTDSVVRGQDGRVKIASGITQDITERKRAEEAMAAAQRQLQSIIDNTPAIVYAFDLDERFIMGNTTLAELFNATPEEMIGKRRHAFMSKEDADWHEVNDRTAIEAGRALEFEEHSQIGDRSITWLTTKFPLRDTKGRIYAVAGISTDITERKRAEIALAGVNRILSAALTSKSEEALGEVCLAVAEEITQSPFGFIGKLDERGLLFDIAISNPGWDACAEITPAGHRRPPENLALRGLFGRVLTESQSLIANDPATHPGRVGIPAGHPPLTAFLGVPLLRDGAVTGMIGVANRTGGYTGAEQRLLEAVAPAITDAFERFRAAQNLRRYATDLERSNEDLQRFAYVSSHDLQEPLRSIVSFSQLLERKYRGKLDADADEYIDFIVEGGNRMQTLILDLLAYSRVNSKAQELRPTDVEAVMAAVERNLDLQLREAGATLTYDPLPVATADPLQLEQVFANLVTNAIKFRRPGERLRIHVGARRLDGFWEFSVKDNGIGIDPQYYDQIFVIFQRLHTKDAYPGTGIGLAIVKRIVDRHGGTVRVESTPGEGSTFFFTLPAI